MLTLSILLYLSGVYVNYNLLMLIYLQTTLTNELKPRQKKIMAVLSLGSVALLLILCIIYTKNALKNFK